MIRTGIERKLNSNDISVSAIERVRVAAQKEGLSEHIEYSVQDFNEARFPPNTYDAVLAVSSIYRVLQLEELLKQIRGTLKADGSFFLG